MRRKIELKIRKRLRQMRHQHPGRELERELWHLERCGHSLGAALRFVITDSTGGWLIRGDAAQLLALSDFPAVANSLLTQFYSLEDPVKIQESGLTIERFGDKRLAPGLLPALCDPTTDRRCAAARVLGWLPSDKRAVRALINVLTDSSQPVVVREQAAESLAYVGGRHAIPVLISALLDPDVRIRFWAVFALGSIPDPSGSVPADLSIIRALEMKLCDDAVPPGNWWSVALEALASLARMSPPESDFRKALVARLRRITEDSDTTPEDRRWLECYSSLAGVT